MKIMIQKMIVTIASIFLLLLLIPVGCGGGGGSGDGSGDVQVVKEAEVKIGAFQFGVTTVFRVTVKSVSGVTDASSFNLKGEDSTIGAKSFNEQAENYVINKTTITLEIYNASGDTVATTILDAADYITEFEGTFSVDEGKPISKSVAVRAVNNTYSAPVFRSVEHLTSSRAQQIGGLDILATGIIEGLTVSNSTRQIQVPLTCGTRQPGNVQPPENEGFFIINDVMIEFNYAFDNPTSFNDVFTVKFIESDRNFDNMKLYFRLPGRTQIINGRTGQVLSAGEAATVFDDVKTAVNTNNPFGGTGIAYVDLRVTQFGPSKLVETTVTRVEGDCVIGARSFTVKESSEAPEPYKALNDRLDKNTLEESLILYILGNEVEVRTATLNSCGAFSPANSGGSEGTLDLWDISSIVIGASFDFQFQAFTEPDKFRVEYPAGSVLLDTGWRGGSTPIDGVLEGPGYFEVENMFTKGASNTLKVLVTGGRSGTMWNYKVRCNDSGENGTGNSLNWPGIKGLWRKSDGIEVRFINESEGYYEKVGFLEAYNFKKGDLGYRVNKVDSITYDMDIKFCYMNSSTPCYWNENFTLVIVDENTLKESDSLIWTRIGN